MALQGTSHDYSSPLIGVTGSTGQLGGRVATRLAALGQPQRLLVRNLARATGLPASYQPETLEEASVSRAKLNPSDWELEAWISTYVVSTVVRFAGQTMTKVFSPP